MKEFLSENWLALIGALAWLPVLIEILISFARRIHYVYLDKHFVYNANATFINNGEKTIKSGMVFVMALNLFVYKQPFFPRSIICKMTLKDGAKHSTNIYEGGLGYTDTEIPQRSHLFTFPENLNININRAIFADQDNIRVLPFFFENLNMSSDKNIDKIEIIFYGRVIKKKIKIKNSDCEKVNYISQYDKIIKKG